MKSILKKIKLPTLSNIPLRLKLLLNILIPLLTLVSISYYAYSQLHKAGIEVKEIAHQDIPKITQMLKEQDANRPVVQLNLKAADNSYIQAIEKNLSETVSEIEALETTTTYSVLIFASITILIALLVNFFISRDVIRFFRKAVSIAEKISEGQRNIKIETPPHKDETAKFLIAMRDMLESVKQAEKAMSDNEKQVRLITDSVPALICYIDVNETYKFCNLQFANSFKKTRDDIVGSSVRDIVGEKVYNTKKDYIRAALNGNEVNFELEYNFSGRKSIVLAHYIPDFDIDNNVKGFFSIIHDITRLKQTEEILRKSEERYDLVLRGTDSGIWDWNIGADEYYYSARFHELLGYTDDEQTELKGSFADYIYPEDIDIFTQAKQVHLEDRQAFDTEVRMRTNTGDYRWYHIHGQAIWDKQNEPIRMAGSISDITERKNTEYELEHQRIELERLSRTDALTGTYNRRSYEDSLKAELERTKRYSSPLSIVMLDIDYFKKINDTHGHIAGDRVLQFLGSTLKECLRPSDIVCRYGGEEFSILLTEADRSAALTTAERLRSVIEETAIPVDDNLSLKITCSFGIAEYNNQIANADAFINMADEALYQAKAAGRNRVIIAGQEEKADSEHE